MSEPLFPNNQAEEDFACQDPKKTKQKHHKSPYNFMLYSTSSEAKCLEQFKTLFTDTLPLF